MNRRYEVGISTRLYNLGRRMYRGWRYNNSKKYELSKVSRIDCGDAEYADVLRTSLGIGFYLGVVTYSITAVNTESLLN